MREVRYREARERAQGPRLARDRARMATVKSGFSHFLFHGSLHQTQVGFLGRVIIEERSGGCLQKQQVKVTVGGAECHFLLLVPLDSDPGFSSARRTCFYRSLVFHSSLLCPQVP